MILRSISSVKKLMTQCWIESAVRRELFVITRANRSSKLRRSGTGTNRLFVPLLTELNGLRGEFSYKSIAPNGAPALQRQRLNNARFILFALMACLICARPVSAQETPVSPATSGTIETAKSFDPVEATKAWLSTVPAAKRARSDAYFEGGYWL